MIARYGYGAGRKALLEICTIRRECRECSRSSLRRSLNSFSREVTTGTSDCGELKLRTEEESNLQNNEQHWSTMKLYQKDTHICQKLDGSSDIGTFPRWSRRLA